MISPPGRRRGLRPWPTVLRQRVSGVAAFAALLVCSPSSAAAQDPPDSVRTQADSTAVDSLAVDPLTVLADSLLADSLLADSLRRDSLAVDTLPLLDPGSPGIVEAGVWEWDQEELLWASGFTLADLLRDVPGIWITRAGDYGAPVTTTGFGTGRLRVRVDGVEVVPYEAGVVDMAQVPLVGLRSVRVRRGVAGVTVDLYTIHPEDARAFSMIEAGTGDLETNLFRGTFMLPRALGGTLTGVMERVDTQGDGREEPGALTGVWLRYTLNRGRRGGIEADFRTRSVKQELFAPNDLNRKDFTLRGRFRIAEGLVASSHYTSSSLNGEGGLLSDTATGEAVSVSGEGIRQLGADLSLRRGRGWGRAGYRRLTGEGVPSSLIDLDVGVADEDWGGVATDIHRQGWDGRSTNRTGLRAWTTDRFGPYAFLEIDRGTTGIPFIPRLDGGLQQADSTGATTAVPGSLRVQERFASRFGLGARWRGLDAEIARIRVEADSVHSLGLPADRSPFSVPGGVRSGFELRARIPLLLLDGLEFRGSAVKWNSAEPTLVDSLATAFPSIDPWPYLPQFTYDAHLHYRNTFLPTGNFEMLVVLGARERDPMTVFAAVDTLPAPPTDPEASLTSPVTSVPFSQTWYARLELRIVSLRVFVEWENLTLRSANQDFPDRIQPRTRAMYGVRWTLRN